MNRFIRRLLAAMLLISLMVGILPAEAEKSDGRAAEGYQFNFTARLEEETLKQDIGDRAGGYTALLDALRFEGTYAHALDNEDFDLNLSIIPLDGEASPVELRIWGTPAYMIIHSSLLGEEQIVLSNDSLLEFGIKTYEHLDVPLQNIALLFPYTWRIGLAAPLGDWAQLADGKNRSGAISAKAVKSFSEKLEADLHGQSRDTAVFIRALGLETGADNTVREILDDLPAYVNSTMTGGKGMKVTRKSGVETWSAACGSFARYTEADDQISFETALPEMASGYQPSLSYEMITEEERRSGRLDFQILGSREGQKDLLDLHADMAEVPASWPMDCDAAVSVNMTGELFPAVHLSIDLQGSAQGGFQIQVREGEGEPVLLRLQGTAAPLEGEIVVPNLTLDDFNASMDILRVNDVTLREFVSKVSRPLAEGMLRFLIGIPTSSCQAILDDLTDMGILGMLLGV